MTTAPQLINKHWVPVKKRVRTAENSEGDTFQTQELNRSEAELLLRMMATWYQGLSMPTVQEIINLQQFWNAAEKHGISGLAGALDLRAGFGISDLKQRARQRYLSNSLCHMKCLAICQKIQDAAAGCGIPFSFIKGPALVESAYHDSGIRSYSDIDVLVYSRRDAVALVRRLEADTDETVEETTLLKRFHHPGRLHANVNDWTVEFCYPVRHSGDPLFDLMHRYPERIFKIPKPKGPLPVPDPEIHLVILIQHTARHLFTRLLWFLDIAVLVRQHWQAMDRKWISTLLDDFKMVNIAGAVSRFLQDHIDSGFPQLARPRPGWNNMHHTAMTSVDWHRRPVNLFYRGGQWHRFTWMLWPAILFLITDPWDHCKTQSCQATRWCCGRLLHGFHLDHFLFYKFFELVIGRVYFPIIRLCSHKLIQSLPAEQ